LDILSSIDNVRPDLAVCHTHIIKQQQNKDSNKGVHNTIAMNDDQTPQDDPDQSALYTLPPPPETILSVRNLTLVANLSGLKFVRKLKARRRRRRVEGKDEIEQGEKGDEHAADLRPAKGVHRTDLEDGAGGEPGYVGEDRNDRPVEDEEGGEDKEDEETEKTAGGRKIILNDVSCECYPREMLAMYVLSPLELVLALYHSPVRAFINL
jgi:hypothetical protein